MSLSLILNLFYWMIPSYGFFSLSLFLWLLFFDRLFKCDLEECGYWKMSRAAIPNFYIKGKEVVRQPTSNELYIGLNLISNEPNLRLKLTLIEPTSNKLNFRLNLTSNWPNLKLILLKLHFDTTIKLRLSQFRTN